MTRPARKAAEGSLARLSAARAIAILEERAHRLAHRSEAPEGSSATRQKLLLTSVGGELYGLPLSEVSRVARLEDFGPAPGRSPALLGMVGHGGEIRPLFDLAALLGAPAGTPSAGGWMILLRGAGARALRVAEAPTAGEVELLDAGRARALDPPHTDKLLVVLSAAELAAASTPTTPGDLRQ